MTDQPERVTEPDDAPDRNRDLRDRSQREPSQPALQQAEALRYCTRLYGESATGNRQSFLAECVPNTIYLDNLDPTRTEGISPLSPRGNRR